MRTFPKCIDSANSQTSPFNEMIVVDHFSNDGIASFAKERGATVIQSMAKRSEARNIGLTKASSDAVLFVDADMILPTNLVEECEGALEDHDALIIPEESIGIGFWAECKVAERRLHVGDEFVEAARCFKRNELLSVGGYDPNLEAGEDWDLQNRVTSKGLCIGRTKATILHDEGHLGLYKLMARKYMYGQTFGRYMSANPRLALRQVDPFHRIVSPSLSIMAKDPLHGVGVLFLRTLEFTAAGAGHVLRKRPVN